MSSLRAKLIRSGDGYVVNNGAGNRIGFLKQYPGTKKWNAVDTYMEQSRDFDTRAEAVEWLDSLPRQW